MQLLKNEKYQAMVNWLIETFPHWEALDRKSLFISGASGMIGSLLIDMIMFHNQSISVENRCLVMATSRSEEAAQARFASWLGREDFFYFPHDISQPLPSLPRLPDLLIHAASTTHPAQYVSEPINTIFANVQGCKNMLELATQKPGTRFLLLSSVEVYGENRGDVDYFDEDYCGYLNCNTLRAGYPEAKRLCEAMCQAYQKEKAMDTVILRLPRIYGPTMRMSDTKAIAQFIKNALAGEDIVLKSEGNQLYSYAFVGDAVLGMLYMLTAGENGQAYNLADAGSDIVLKDLAAMLAEMAGTKVIFDLPDNWERAGYSTATKALLLAEKLKSIGWKAQYNMKNGLHLTLEILREEERNGI